MVYKFKLDFEYTSNGCDCCEPTKWEVYTCDSTGKRFTTEEECYVHAIKTKTGSDMIEDLYWNDGLTLIELIAIAVHYDVEVEID